MENYKKVEIYLKEELFNEIEQLTDYRNARLLVRNMDKKPKQLDSFIIGCIVHYLKDIKKQDVLAGYDDLGKPYRLKNRLKEYLKKRGMLQKDLAAKTEIDEGNISSILNNKNQPSTDYFLRIWIALGCPALDEIFYREKE